MTVERSRTPGRARHRRVPQRSRATRNAALALVAFALPLGSALPVQAVPAPQGTPAVAAAVALPRPAAPVALPATPRVSYTVAVGAANVRRGPGTDRPVVGTVTRGRTLTGTVAGSWLRIGPNRYVGTAVLRRTGSTATAPVASARTLTRYVTAASGNVRSGPGLGHRVVGSLARGTRVAGTPTAGGWLALGTGRYVSGAILTSTPPRGTADVPSRSRAQAPPRATAAGTPSRQAVLAVANRYTGIMYAWGGEDPSGFDCSGYSQFVFGRLGVNLPRTTAQQKAATTPVASPRPGDLVFWGTWHVAIYAGKGQIYDSGRPGLPTQKRAMFAGVTGYGRVG